MNITSTWTRLRHALGSYPTTASEWTVRAQSSDVTRRELLALDEWLKTDPRNAEAYARVSQVAHLGLILRDYPEERARLPVYAKLRAETPQPELRWHRWYLIGGVTAALATSLGMVLLLVLPLSPPIDYRSARGEQRQIALADGSRIIVNTDSEVKIKFSERERSIALSRGEAFFEVAKDPSRPFVVRTDNAQVRAIGTKFSVHRLDQSTEVVVTEGRVEVVRADVSPGASADRAAYVTPGQFAKVSVESEAIQVAAADIERVAAWTRGDVEFEEAMLSEVIQEVNRYSVKQFQVDDLTLDAIRFSGRFHVGDVDSVKFALKERFGISATESGGVIHLTRQ